MRHRGIFSALLLETNFLARSNTVAELQTDLTRLRRMREERIEISPPELSRGKGQIDTFFWLGDRSGLSDIESALFSRKAVRALRSLDRCHAASSLKQKTSKLVMDKAGSCRFKVPRVRTSRQNRDGAGRGPTHGKSGFQHTPSAGRLSPGVRQHLSCRPLSSK